MKGGRECYFSKNAHRIWERIFWRSQQRSSAADGKGGRGEAVTVCKPYRKLEVSTTTGARPDGGGSRLPGRLI